MKVKELITLLPKLDPEKSIWVDAVPPLRDYTIVLEGGDSSEGEATGFYVAKDDFGYTVVCQ